MKLFPKLDHDDWMFFSGASALLIIPALIGGCIGGCVANRATNVSHSNLQDYAAAVSNRFDRIEYALDRFVIPVQPKEVSHE